MRRMQPPLSFEANGGQVDHQVRFLARGRGYSLYLTDTETVLALTPPAARERDLQRRAAVRMRLRGGEASPVVEGLDASPTRSNYFIGREPSRWRTNVPHYARVRLRDVYPGVDEIFHGVGGQFEYDFVVRPGGEPSRIRIAFDGVDALRVSDARSLVLRIGTGEIEQRAPNVYQDIDGSRHAVAARYVLTGPREIGFELAAYDRTRPLVIDPVVVYATYLGGGGSDYGNAVAIDSAGGVYVTGVTASTDFPTVNPVQPARGSTTWSDAFVLKIDPTGTRVLYATYFGGSLGETGAGIAVDAGGNAYVTGETRSTDFPTQNAVQPAPPGGNGNAFVLKLKADGSLAYSTYLGGSNGAYGRAIAVDRDGRACVTGDTFSTNFPVVNALQAAKRGTSTTPDAFISKLDASGGAFVYSTYLGGTAYDTGRGIAVDAAGNAYVAGDVTGSVVSDFPTLNARQPAFGGGTSDAFIARIAPGGALLYSTYLGGKDADVARAIAVTPDGRAYITGSTRSFDFPAVNAYKPALGQATAFKSTDGGQSWRALGLDGLGVASIAIDRLNPATVYAATGNGLFKTTDGGVQWTSIASSAFDLVAVDPFNSRTLYAARSLENLQRSGDGGQTWGKIAVDTSPRHTVLSLAIDPGRPQKLYVGSYSALARTEDGGASWAYTGTQKARAIAVDPLNPSTVYAGREGDGSDDYRGGIFKSGDGGASWVGLGRGSIPPGPKNYEPNVYALVVDPRTTSTIYLVAGAGVFKSTAGGNGWTAMNTGLPPQPIYAGVSLVIDPLNPSVLYLGTSGNGIFKTSDGGATWAAVNNGLLHLSIGALAVSPSEPGVVYAGTRAATDDAFLASLSADGGSLLSSTFLGGGGNDVGNGVAVDARGNAYVTGTTSSTGFPAVDAFQPAPGGAEDAFVAAFNAAGSRLLYASYIGGSGSDHGYGIAADPAGNVVITGDTTSTNFPVTRPLLPPHAAAFQSDAFVVKIGPASSGADVRYSTARLTPPDVPTASSRSAHASEVFTTRDGVRYQVETVAADLDSPWAMAFAPDGRLFVSERIGRVRIFNGALRSSSIALTVGDVFAQGEAGLLGLALDPDFSKTPFVYLYYTARAGAGAVNRIVRYREAGGQLIERVVLLDGIPGNTVHNGGRLRFGPDDLLYITTGDAGAPSLAQDLGSLAGKILRLNRDGTTPRGNPSASPIFSSGHRDPQGIDWNPVTGDLWSDEGGLGGNGEINIVAPGGNYGWPRVAGRDGLRGMQPPAAVFGAGVAPSGGSFYRAQRMAPFEDDFFVATLSGHGLLRLRVDPSSPRRIVDQEWLADGGAARLRDVAVGADGLLYVVTSDARTDPGEPRDRILRIVPR
jgi:glucose/arabinose dehydrogenase/photosystem II stability/assembly factor-like uncharacterized protein